MSMGRRFLIWGSTVSVSSVVVQQLALQLGAEPRTASYVRLSYGLLPIYFGFSRWVLRDLWLDELARLGRWRTELRMIGRVASSIAASIGLKLLLEPSLTAFLLARFGRSGAGAAAFLGDYTYGPLASYLTLVLTGSSGATTAAES